MIICLLKISEMLFYPVLCAAAAGLFFCFFRKKEYRLQTALCAALLLMAGWRSFYGAGLSRRYVCMLMIPAIWLAAFAFLELQRLAEAGGTWKKWLVWGVLACCIVLQMVKIFHADPHSSLLALKQDVKRFLKAEPGAVFLIDDNELCRVGDAAYPYIFPLPSALKSPREISAFLDQYRYWGNPVYLIRQELAGEVSLQAEHLKNFSMNKEGVYFKDRRHKKRLSVYRCVPESLPVMKGTENLIPNGDMEKIMPQDKRKARMKIWIDHGASFYGSDRVRLPEHQILLPLWMPLKSYPELFADHEKPLNGKFSLNIRFVREHAVYLMQKLPAVPGVLSWKMRALEHDAVLWLTRYDYEVGGKMYYPPMQYYMLLRKDQERFIRIDLSEAKFEGCEMLFLLRSEDAHILLDDVSFCPEKEMKPRLK